MTTETTTKKPVHHIRLYGVEATIWPNPAGFAAPFSITIQRVYRDQNGNWKGSGSLRPQDLLTAGKVLGMALDWLWVKLQELQPAGE
ncbi:MAG TPA: hypothetical protein VFF65_02855 [Phycisphaerales bacterium]|nr:hypothetical protein [Phycisphaerales bacterium]